MKLIAFYLPQFHQIPENDKWWGKGFTEWVNVKKAKVITNGQRQPRVPFNNNYYNLENIDVIKWQIDIAKKHGIYGFCFYHYWYSGKLLLEKPVEAFLNNKSLDIHFCISWANHSWTNSWVSQNTKTLLQQTYGGQKEWEEHFQYLLPFFKDERYLLVDDKPILLIFCPEDIPNLEQRMQYIKKRAVDEGLKGITFAYQGAGIDIGNLTEGTLFDYDVEYQPSYVFAYQAQKRFTFLRQINRLIRRNLKRILQTAYRTDRFKGLQIWNYDEAWNSILNFGPIRQNSIPGAFVDWDNTPRKQERGSLCVGSTPEKFQYYLTKQIKRAREIYKSDFMFIFAWNEWAEGGYLEPDADFGFGNLEAIRESLLANNEWPYEDG